jgi:hypothetical protein
MLLAMNRQNLILAILLSCALASCGARGSSTPLKVRGDLPLPGVGSATAYKGPQGIFDTSYSGFKSIITVLDTGEVYGVDTVVTLIPYGTSVAGFFHGTVSGTSTTMASTNLVEYNAADGGFIQPASLSATYADPSLQASLTFPFGKFDGTANGKKPATPIGIAYVAGTYDGEFSSVGTTMKLYSEAHGLVVSDTGSFSVTAKDCSFSGTLARHEGKGVFGIAAIASGPDCAIAGPMKGLMIPVSVSSADTTLAFAMLSLDAKKSAMLYAKKQKENRPL